MKKVFFLSYGCASNLADSEIMKGLLSKHFKLVKSLKECDLAVINTCIVKTPTEKRMINKIKEITKGKKPLIVAGCMPKVEREIIEKINPKASLIGPDSIEKIVDVAHTTIKGEKAVFLENLRKPKLCLPRVQENKIIRIIQVAEGCAWQNCTYCIVKLARGRIFSYPLELIKREVEQAIEEGNKEIWLTSQDLASYGFEKGKLELPLLLEEICKIRGKFFVRVGMMNPLFTKKISEDLVRAYKNEKIFKFLHLPIQSFSEKVLEDMKRGYKPKDVLEIVEKFYKTFPNLTFSTDIIVGFPSETEQDFQETLKFIEKVKPDIVNISKFGPRPKTEAEKMEKLPENLIKKRSKEAFELVRRISFEKNQKWVEWEGLCLVDEKGTKKKTFIARNFAYKPIVVKSEKNLLGQFKPVRVIEAKSNYLIGKII
ncbi:MAG: tRNA (N(6)-L-threonylcarbamoyladenosine(37)-C(2))-methylthiotransferase [Candidatus Aenigmarchaeota archaeon]|nr:tRNA (N(6)-L-threonylcarbamoyladenosine(37)-C(2))-methylthiotransferase [Candidatus Aenigmarchaeota archaeon]